MPILSCDTEDLEWKKFKGHEGDDDFKTKLYEMYNARPIDTPLKNKEDLLNYYPCNTIILCKSSSNIPLGGIMWWQSEYGNKISTSFSSSPEIYKKYIVAKYVELLNLDGYYAELSDAIEHLVKKEGGLENIKDKEVIMKVVGVLEKDIFHVSDERRNEYKLNNKPSPEGSYLRNIKGIGIHRKALYGKPCLSKTFQGEDCNKKCIVLNDGGRPRFSRRCNKVNRLKSKKKQRKCYSKKSIRIRGRK
jgi:hypothetical protein